jgi:aspartyl-tRNA(Asn)/glutamyl-tRNA(Gln) amidotransferase subunit A
MDSRVGRRTPVALEGKEATMAQATGANEICRMEAVQLAGEIRARNLSVVEVVDAVFERMERLEPVVHAFCTPTPEAAREDAGRIDAELAAGRDPGPLAGVPVGIKDLVATKGIRTVMGSWAYADFVPDEDDVVVERLKAAGAIVIGKTNVPEFGYSGVGHNPVFETTVNPWNTELTSGGSSAGSGAAVAGGMGPFAIGSDGGGSVRIPSSFCGLFGMKASWGRVPLYPGVKDERYPGVSSWESLEHIGPMSRTVADGALMLSVIAGPDDRDRNTLPAPDFDWMETLKGDLTGLRVAYSADWGYAAVDPRVRDVVGRAVEVFERDLGCTVEAADPGWENPYEAFWGIVINETDLVGMRRLADELGDRMTPHLAEVLQTEWTAEQLTSAVMTRKAVYNKMWRFMRTYDLLLTPTLAVPPFETGIQGPTVIDGREVDQFEWLHFTYPLNLTGQPAATVPAGFTDDGLPIGLQIVGRHLDDPLVLRAAAAFEAASPWKHRWPPLLDELGL